MFNQKKTLIIAEAGVNHNGEIRLAKKLIDIAKESGADAVKFQTFKAEAIASKNAEKAAYQKESTDGSESQLKMLKSLELDHDSHFELMAYCRQKEIQFLSTGFDLLSLDFLHKLDLPIFKIPSGEITNLPYLRQVGNYRKPVIMSTGMADLGVIEDALKILTESGLPRDSITVLHCNTEYPTPFEDVNLNAMITIRDAFKVQVGYSDHTSGVEVAIAAVAMGARVIEKHFTIDRNLPGPDHKASLVPDELKQMVAAIRNIEKAMGDGIKNISQSEMKNIAIARKSIVALTKIKKGETFSEKNITVKRPGLGISPMHWNEVIGKNALKDFSEDDLVEI
jgi:N,N'-diacetyllegionaminate synthase